MKNFKLCVLMKAIAALTLLAISEAEGLFCQSTQESVNHPFTCPNKIPAIFPQPGEYGGGYHPNQTLSKFTSEEYNEFQAAISLAPCDSKPIQVFTTNNYQKDKHSVAVIFTESSYGKELENWLKTKYDLIRAQNPIRELADNNLDGTPGLYNEPTGREILDSVCPAYRRPTMTFNSKNYGEQCAANQFRCNNKNCVDESYKSDGENDCGDNSDECPEKIIPPSIGQGDNNNNDGNNNVNVYPTEDSTTPRHGSYYGRHKRHSYYSTHTSVHQSAKNSEVVFHLPIVQVLYYYPKLYQPYTYYENINLDDAPEPLFGIRIRTRRDFSCGDDVDPELCDELERQGKFVNCTAERFSGCSAEWVDCVKEDEEYLVKNNVYQKVFELLPEEHSNTDDRCLAGSKYSNINPFPGYKATRGREEDEAIGVERRPLNKSYHYRQTRQTPEPHYSSVRHCRIIITKLGQKRKRCDRFISKRQTSYREAREYTPPPMKPVEGPQGKRK